MSEPTSNQSDAHDSDIQSHATHIANEFKQGFEFVKKYPRSVTIFGSAQLKPETKPYKDATSLTSRITKELKYAVITGGGPGIMEAANKGALEGGGPSIGMNISLPHDHFSNKYSGDSMRFSYFFSRKAIMTFAAEAFVFFPGGFGTLDELFGILTLVQTDKIPRVPVILFGSEYWNGLSDFLEKIALNKFHTISADNMKLFEITDSADRAIEIIKNAPVMDWWRKVN